MICCFFKRFRNLNSFIRFYSNELIVLGVESSCDDTAAAVVNGSGFVLGESLISQSRIHSESGGILPHVASSLHRHHLKNVVESSMAQSELKFNEVDAIAVTVKPGLILSLEAGVEYAKDLCVLYKRPLIPIHHMEAHALTVRLTEDVRFPYVALLISGGHCFLCIVESLTKFYKLGEALDASPGQVFDKLARRAKLLNITKLRKLGGGAAIEAAALNGDPTAIQFQTHILQKEKKCNFSFSGIGSYFIQYLKKEEIRLGLQPDEVVPNISDLCSSFQWAIAKHLCQRLEIAFIYIKEKKLLQNKEQCLVVSGGVSSNNFIRSALKFVCDQHGYRIVIPPAKYCTDNGVMIAWNGIEKLKNNLSIVQPKDLQSVHPLPKSSLGQDISNDVSNVLYGVTIKYSKFNEFINEYRTEKTKGRVMNPTS